MDRLKAMHTFVQIAEHGSLTRAAAALDSSLPAVVRMLAALESHLGVRLFHRTTRRVTLTQEGRRYLDSARDVLQAADAADRALKDEAAEPAGRLVVTAPVLFGHMYVAPAIARFLQHHPQVQCSVLLNDRNLNLFDEGIDVGVRIGALADSSLVAQTLGTVRPLVVASPAHLRRHGTPAHPRELRDANCVRVHPGATTHWRFLDRGRPFDVAPRGNLAFNHIAPAIEACAAGMGFGRFFSYQVLPHLAQGRLLEVLAPFALPPQPVSLVYPHARLLPARTRAYIDWMKREFDGLEL